MFAEKLMLVVTSVLECRYCNWMHSELAIRFGVEPSDIESLLSGDYSVVSEYERIAVVYALNYSKTDGQASTTELLSSFYPKEVAEDIVWLVKFVFLTNKLGNTYDAFLARLRGQGPKDSSLLVEAAVVLTMTPLYGSVAMLTRKGRNPYFSLDT
ncbi:hypothetical protein F1529_04675 [Alcanivorax sp. VBW004]|jgi:AhpD family alkylhydroperoxidase|uniref:hypothetical protein n=1 Tax=Alcanivorax sp. VBW004 TaxID=1287708 RepID=UPI0012BC887F|nr:hypothetical protein [Alcanivorax sp. VBW004]MTT51777.1 hypothetical protein [Alcanivorax sp. VBW004]